MSALVVVLGLYFAAVTLVHYTQPDMSLLARLVDIDAPHAGERWWRGVMAQEQV